MDSSYPGNESQENSLDTGLGKSHLSTGKKCIICGSRSSKESSVRFHRFPKDPQLSDKWAQITAVKCVLVASILARVSKFCVCSKHFVSSDYYPSGRNLLPNAVPRPYSTSARKSDAECQKAKRLTGVIENIEEKPLQEKTVSEDKTSNTSPVSFDSYEQDVLSTTVGKYIISSAISTAVGLGSDMLHPNERGELESKIIILENENKTLQEKVNLLEEELKKAKKQSSDIQAAAEKLAAQALKDAFKNVSHQAIHKQSARRKRSTGVEEDTEASTDKVELAKGSGIFVMRHEKILALAFSRMNICEADEQAQKYEEALANIGKRSTVLPPLYTTNKELYRGPYDPLKLIRFLLRVLFSPEELSLFSANGKRLHSGGNMGIPQKTLDAVFAFVIEHCPNVALTSRHIKESINHVCCYARKVVNNKKGQTNETSVTEAAKNIKEEEIEEIPSDVAAAEIKEEIFSDED